MAERIVYLDPVGTMQIENGSPVRLRVDSDGVTVLAGTYAGRCQLGAGDDRDWLTASVGGGGYLAELLSSYPRAVVRVLTYLRAEVWPSPRDIGLDELALEQVTRLNPRAASFTQAVAWLAKDLVLDGPASGVVLSSGGSEKANGDAFRLVGALLAVDVRLVDERLLVHRITRRSRTPAGNLLLVRGVCNFVDALRASGLSPAELLELQRIAASDNAYLQIWREYNALEREAAVTAARDIGWAEYDECRLRADGQWEFTLRQSKRSDALRQRLGSDTLGLEAGESIGFDGGLEARGSDTEIVIGEAHVATAGTILMRADTEVDPTRVPRRGYLAGAYTLDRARLDRRESAQGAIAAASTFPVQQLTRILADQPAAGLSRWKRHEPMSARVREILGGEPTAAQLEAIDLAVNCQDLAVIQGPPGTGKTRVIAAIQARLSEVNREAPALTKRVLLTSYQHDAVRNLVDASSDGRLPAVKLGRQAGQTDEASLEAWALALRARLDLRYADARPNEFIQAQRALADRTTSYRHQPSDVPATVLLLRWIADRVDLVGLAVAHEATTLARHLARQLGAAPTARIQAAAMHRARGLRTTHPGFLDDGPQAASRAFQTQEFFDLLDAEQRRWVERAARDDGSVEELTEALRGIKQDVLNRILDSRARATIVATMPAVEALLERAKQSAEIKVNASVSPVERAVEDFRHALLEQPRALRTSLEMHTRALAATCQQAASRHMRTVQTVPFDTVIVDEAARANPLDLMIPMTMASGRMVLVGDHRQLPQLLDETVVPLLSDRHDPGVVQTVLSRSLFERLFSKLVELEGRDGVKRAVTLDRQFRTHPVLGAFINEQFYAPYGEQVLNADEDPTGFQHRLERYGQSACGWIDVPHSRGAEVGGGTRSRPAEASVIVNELDLSLQEDPQLTFGVITFYKGQERALWATMRDAGLAVSDDGGYVLNPSVPRLWTANGLPRVRIGTVDAFQGREFDVVYLSTTRSNRARGSGKHSFGFLVLPNRLCVAMSRQRSLLVAVGDAEMFSQDDARELTPSLAAFHDLTGGEHGFRRSA